MLSDLEKALDEFGRILPNCAWSIKYYYDPLNVYPYTNLVTFTNLKDWFLSTGRKLSEIVEIEVPRLHEIKVYGSHYDTIFTARLCILDGDDKRE